MLYQSQTIEERTTRLQELEVICQQQSKKIAGLQEEIEFKDQELNKKNSSANHSIQTLTSELRTVKSALEEVNRRERTVS